MSSYGIFGGFLGAGKTTSLMAFSEYFRNRGVKPAILVNDLGAKNLVDQAFTASRGFLSEDITGDCICYQTENLVDKLRRFRDRDGADVILSDIPGCGIGGLDHVYHALDREYHGEFRLLPFTAVVDPERLRMIMPEGAQIHLPKEMDFLFDAQMKEAEVILLNKTELLEEEKVREILAFLRRNYPHAEIFAISAKEGTGVAEAAEYLLAHESALPVVDIGYGEPEFLAAEQTMSWYNRQFFVKGDSFDGNAFLTRLMDGIRAGLAAADRNVPHLKAMGETEQGELVKVSLTGIDYALDWAEKLPEPCTSLSVVLNARGTCESERLEEIMHAALRETAAQFGLKLRIFFTECFGMMDEGRL